MTKTRAPKTEPASTTPPGGRRLFSDALKRQIVDESCQPHNSVSAVARRYQIAVAVLFRWRRALGVEAPPARATFLPVQLADNGVASPEPRDREAQPVSAVTPPIVVERPLPGVEIELLGGRRVRFDQGVDTETMKRVVAALEGVEP